MTQLSDHYQLSVDGTQVYNCATIAVAKTITTELISILTWMF